MNMLGLNNIQVIGNLGGAPDMRFLDGGRMHVVNFSVAVNERWKNRNDEPQERTTWLRVVAFNGLGQTCAEHLAKGDGVYVEGRLQIREYDDKDGNQRTSVEIVASRVRFLGRGNGNGNGSGDERHSMPGQPRSRSAQSETANYDQGIADDDVPF